MISKIYHISDVHFRLYKRHNEYKSVIDRLLEYIDVTKDDDSVIVLAGDIVHSKTDMSPELISIVSKFFKDCADRLPTILIIGNHDLNLSNKSRLDALTPIVESMGHPNLHYWKDSGLREFNGVTFSVLSIADKRENWILASQFDAPYKIALYHGPIHGCVNDQDQVIGGYGIPVDVFNGFDLGICGDIHRFQYMNSKKTVGYSSSLICQSFSEHPTKHGILVWDLKSKSSEFVQIPNDYAYVTINIKDGKYRIPDDLPRNIRLRIKHETSTPLQIDRLIDKISKRYNIVELVKIKISTNNIASIADDKVFGNSRDISYQNDVISEYLLSVDSTLTEDDLSLVKELNVDINKTLNSKPVIRNTVWRPKRLEFSNMFSYGENNVIDFNQLSGVYGLVGENARGKSSALNILCFSLYDKVPTATKASHILNVHKSSFRCKITFEIDGVDYFIERIGTKKPDGSVRVDVNFWYYDEHGIEVSLNGEDRDKTNYVIREYVGQYDDFMMTALSTQYDNQSFVEKSQRERKELLYKFLDISIYDELWRIAKEQSKEYQVLIKQYETYDLRKECEVLSNQIAVSEDYIKSLSVQLSEVKKIKQQYTDQLVSLNKEYIPISSELDYEQIVQSIKNAETEIKNAETEIIQISKDIALFRDELSKLEGSDVVVDGDMDILNRRLKDAETKYAATQSQIDMTSAEISHCENKRDKLSTHRYDPNCRYCVENEFVIDAQLAINLLPELNNRLDAYRQELLKYSTEIESIVAEISILSESQAVLRDIDRLNNQIKLKLGAEQNLRDRVSNFKYNLAIEHTRLQECERNRVQIERNEVIQRSIENINNDLKIIERKYNSLQEQIKIKYADIEKNKKQYADAVNKMNTYIEYLKKYRTYELYIKAISKEGVPYKILQTVLPVIEHEVNIILNQISEFSVRLETVDEKNIHAYIVYDELKSWPVELTSGMERFMLSLAFRQALCEITSLPRANFMAIDEGFGVLDSENLQAIVRLFAYLKDQYDYLLIISHIDSMRDMVDKQIRIDKIDGYSKISV